MGTEFACVAPHEPYIHVLTVGGCFMSYNVTHVVHAARHAVEEIHQVISVPIEYGNLPLLILKTWDDKMIICLRL